MKKIFSILFASVIALMAVSCYPEDFAVFDTSKATAPVLGSYEVGEKAITANFTPGSFNQNFNKAMQPNHFFVITSVDGEAMNKALTTSNKDGVLSVSTNTLNSFLIGLGYVEGDIVSLTMHIRASMQTNAGDNGRNGYVDSKDAIDIRSFEIVFPKGSPYQEYTETSPWGITGTLGAYNEAGFKDWESDLEMWATPDGMRHVAKYVKLNEGEKFKFRKDAQWADNYGGTFGSLDTPFAAEPGGADIVIPATGYYDLWLDIEAGTAMISEAYVAYPGCTETSAWGVTGTMSQIEGFKEWSDDLPMLTDGNMHVAQGVKLSATDKFKFRKDHDWAENYGGVFASLGTDFAAEPGGADIVVGADGVYDLILDIGAGTARVIETLGGGVSGIVGGDEPGPEPPAPTTGWNIIGLNGDWENDVLAKEDNGVWTAYITATDETSFKWRKDGAWTENYGAPGEDDPYVCTLDEPFSAVAAGKNIGVSAGFYKVVLDVSWEFPTITVSAGDVWSLIGDFNSWSGDVDMVLVDGKWVSPPTKLNENGFKIRHNHDWSLSVGGSFEAFGQPFEAISEGGPDIKLPGEGDYIVTYDPEAQTITVEKSISGWNVIGLNGDWENDVLATEKDGVWSVRVNVEDATTFKWRKDGAWTENVGGTMAEVGVPFEGGQDGPDIPIEAGYWLLTLDMTGATPMLTVADGEIWSLIGDFNGWNDDVDMVLTDGKWVSPETHLTANGFKIRHNHDWSLSVGGSFEAFGEPFAAISENGPDIKLPEDGDYIVTYDPEAQTIMVETALPSQTWSVIGSVDGTMWNKDFYMTDHDGVWVSEELEFGADAEFKVRFDNSWADENTVGAAESGVQLVPGHAIAAVHPGNNMKVEQAGKYRVVFDTNRQIVYLQGWALIGNVAGTSWNQDFLMTVGSDGRWYSDPVKISGEFKIRYNGSWADADTRGAKESGFKFTPLTPFEVEGPGNNINVPEEGMYTVAFDADKNEVTVYRSEWALIGEVGGTSWTKDFFLVEYEAGVYTSYPVVISGEFKLRRNSSWADADTRGYAESGFTFTSGTAFTVTGPGSNVKAPESATYVVKYTPATETVVATKQ